MSDSKKFVKNTLFSPSVTGSTYEDISQNAILLPAMEKPLQPVLNLSSEQILQNTLSSNTQDPSVAVLTPVESLTSQPQISTSTYFQPEPENLDLNRPSPHPGSNLTSVLSSFSQYLRLGTGGTQQNQVEIESIAAPILLDIAQDNKDAPPVPLFDPTAAPVGQVLGTPSGPVNTFRRAGLKRPVYAPVPGLSSNHPAQSNPQYYFSPPPPPSVVSTTSFQPPVNQLSISPASSTSSIQDVTFALNSQFKPINPQPSSVPSVKPSVPQPQHSTHLLSLGPVMDAIPASEALPSVSDTVTNGNRQGTPVSVTKTYRPVYHHWFYRKGTEKKSSWAPFSMVDSLTLEHAFTSNDLDPDKVIATDGGRYDVNILRRQKTPVYWKGDTCEVRRCSWFYKNTNDRNYVPYEENIAAKLEEEFKIAFESNQWHRKISLINGDTIEFHGPDVLVLVVPAPLNDSWPNTPNQTRPRIVKRGMDEFDIDEGEPTVVDHVLFMVHGIGSVCDLKLRTVEEVVDEFRNIALQLTQSHYKSSCEQGMVNRVEVLPISWHSSLHSKETGVDEQLKNITLESIPKLRAFTNDTILDVLFYTSPVYCQTIISTVGNELNRVFNLFKERNVGFKGGVSVAGHSLGSLIVFDLLSHQYTDDAPEEEESKQEVSNENKTLCRRISYMMGSVGAGQPKISYPQLEFKPSAFFALGSPIGMFVTVRGLDKLGENFSLPTCPAFFNIFHPYDPVAYRIEALVNPEIAKLKPVLIPHHKGRKRMHLELKETMAKVGADLKQKVFDSMKNTWNSFYQLAMFHKSDQPALEAEVNNSIQSQLETTPEEEEHDAEPLQETTDIPLGHLNNGRRIDYVLQEAPLEFFNEYIFAITSHVCYWESEDSILMILKEIYSSLQVQTDSKIPQQTMTIERPLQKLTPPMGMDPTCPVAPSANLPPPPTTGFMKKT
ncbi:phospholipase DDHD2 isoform X3 [Euwallacea fornicatus]|uniref:phospholipase DDHD2 isoform X3 n=1 Tax=Euwallacea fornicatus TaxID=995702 RepID=UPI00338E7BB2